jgi:hypothetical protein
MDPLRTKNHAHLVPIHPENTKSKDWVVLLEASTIVGPSPERLQHKIKRSYGVSNHGGRNRS